MKETIIATIKNKYNNTHGRAREPHRISAPRPSAFLSGDEDMLQQKTEIALDHVGMVYPTEGGSVTALTGVS